MKLMRKFAALSKAAATKVEPVPNTPTTLLTRRDSLQSEMFELEIDGPPVPFALRSGQADSDIMYEVLKIVSLKPEVRCMRRDAINENTRLLKRSAPLGLFWFYLSRGFNEAT